MSHRTPHIDVNSMPIGDRIELMSALWDSLSAEAQSSPLTPEQAAEVRHRLKLFNAGQMESSPWSEARQRIINRPSRCS